MFCTDGAATVIKSYSPELIVHPYLPDEGAYEAKYANATAVRCMPPSLDMACHVYSSVCLGRRVRHAME